MNSMPRIKAIVFDAYGTLFDIATLDQRLAHHFGEKAKELAPVWRRKQLEYTWLRSLMCRYKDFYTLTKEALLFACEQSGLHIDDAITGDLMEYYNRLQVFPEVKEALEALYPNFQLAILSNANPGLLEKAVAFNGIGQYLSAVFSVDAIGQYKPHPAVYQLPCDGMHIEKEAVLFVSANTWDVAGAKSAGLQVAWIRRKAGPVEQLGFPPDLIVGGLDGILVG